jgi:hypothetical protein
VKHEIEAATVACIVEFRSDALRHDASPLKVWGQVGDRVKMASMIATDAREWCSMIQHKMRIVECSKYSAAAQIDLVSVLSEADQREWLMWAFDNHAFLMASARLTCDENKAAKKAREATKET